MFISREAQRANSISYKHTTILTILSFELTVFEMQCIYEIEGSVILVQSYKHLLCSRKGLCFRPPPLCSASSGFLDLLCCWRLGIESSVAMAYCFSPQRDCHPVTAPAQFAYLWFTGKLAEYGNSFFYILLFKIIFFLYKK
jgi:hypothetical protein